jgi:cytidylate kinase
MSQTFVIVAIDGGAASGKSSTSRALSERFNLLHVDTGSHYRFVTHNLLARGLSPEDESAVAAALAGLRPGTRLSGRSSVIEIGGCVPGEEIRGPQVNAAVSRFAAQPAVRQFLLEYQRSQAQVAREAGFSGLVMEGRDIGSVIFPQADFRFFLHADPTERARRRAAEGQTDSIQERDRLDATRQTAPLTIPAGASAIDSTHMTLSQVVDYIGRLLSAKLGVAAP